MERPTTFFMTDHLVNGELARLLRIWREQGLSFRAIAAELAGRDIEVSHETVRRWCEQEGIA